MPDGFRFAHHGKSDEHEPDDPEDGRQYVDAADHEATFA